MRIAFPIALLAAALLAACSSQPPAPEQKASNVEDRQGTQVGEVKKVEAGGNIDANDLSELKNPKSILSKREVFFDYDSYVIKPEFQNLIQAHAKFLVAKPKMKMLIQGNADERGSREYNLALGQKRAEAVKKALLLLGAREDQLESVSLGKEKPRCSESTEECWAQNRRGDMLYSGEY